MKTKKRKYTKKKINGEAFDLMSLKPETGEITPPRTEASKLMYIKLDELEVGQSYRMPINLISTFTNARNAHKRNSKKIFILRKLDSHNFRCWRLADGIILKTSRKAKA